jgi:hypothetical protein
MAIERFTATRCLISLLPAVENRKYFASANNELVGYDWCIRAGVLEPGYWSWGIGAGVLELGY